MNSRASEIAIYLCTYLRASFQRKALMHAFHTHLLVLYEQTENIAATKLAWTVVMFNGSEASGPLTNCRARRCIKSFGGQKGGSLEPLEPPLPTGLVL